MPSTLTTAFEDYFRGYLDDFIISATPLTPIDLMGKTLALGSGTKVQDVNQLLTQFREMQGMMKQMSRGALPKNLSRMMRRG